MPARLQRRLAHVAQVADSCRYASDPARGGASPRGRRGSLGALRGRPPAGARHPPGARRDPDHGVGRRIDAGGRSGCPATMSKSVPGAREASRGRWCEGEAGCNRAILAGRESPRSGHWPRDRDFVGGVGTRPTVVHTDIGGCAEGARHVVDVLVVAEAGFFPAHDDVGTHKCGGDFPDEVGIGSQGHGPCHYEGRKYGGQLPFGQDSSPQYAARFPCGMTIGIVVRTNLRVVTAAPRRWRRAGFRQNRRARSQPSRAPTRLFALGAPRGARSRHGVLRQGHGEAVLSVEGERPFAERRRAGQPPSWWRQPSQYSARAGPFRARAACSGGIRLFVAMH
jgi:hypothetical protein